MAGPTGVLKSGLFYIVERHKKEYVLSDVDVGGNVSMNSNSFFVSRGRQGKNQVSTTEATSGRLEADSPVIVSLAEEIQSSTPSKSGRGGILSPTPLPPSSPSLSSPSISHRCSLVPIRRHVPINSHASMALKKSQSN